MTAYPFGGALEEEPRFGIDGVEVCRSCFTAGIGHVCVGGTGTPSFLTSIPFHRQSYGSIYGKSVLLKIAHGGRQYHHPTGGWIFGILGSCLLTVVCGMEAGSGFHLQHTGMLMVGSMIDRKYKRK